jgi:D-tyrosyl-tRNA(Tyr) deacylase
VRIVLQRVSSASVRVDGQIVGRIGRGVCLLVGVGAGDTTAEVLAAADKIASLRIFPDEGGKMNLALGEVSGQALVVSQFTLLGSVRKGRRPSFTAAAPPETARPLVEALVAALADRGVAPVQGRYGARMAVELINDGPVTLVLDVSGGRVS